MTLPDEIIAAINFVLSQINKAIGNTTIENIPNGSLVYMRAELLEMLSGTRKGVSAQLSHMIN